MRIDLTKSEKVREVMKKLGYKKLDYKNSRKMVLRLYHCPVKPGLRAIAKYLKVSQSLVRYNVFHKNNKNKHPRGGVYRTMDNIVKDLDTFVGKGKVDKDLLTYSPSLRAFIEKFGGKEKAKEKLEELSKYTINGAVTAVEKDFEIKMDKEKLLHWLGQLDLNIEFRKLKKSAITIPIRTQKMIEDAGLTLKDIVIGSWRELRDLNKVASHLGFSSIKKLDLALRNTDSDFGVNKLVKM